MIKNIRILLINFISVLIVIGIIGFCDCGLKVAKASDKNLKVVAVLDTGINYDHPDLRKYMWKNDKQSSGIYGTYGYDFYNGDKDPMDDNGHGTHCAGIILNRLKELGLSDDVKIMAIKVMDEEGEGGVNPTIKAYRYLIKAKKAGVNIVAVNNSWGVIDNSKTLENLIVEAGRLGIASINAAGNSGANLDIEKIYPAGWHLPYTITVGASTKDKEMASFSCYGKNSVDFLAYGTDVKSTFFKPAFISNGNLGRDIIWDVKKGEPVNFYQEGSLRKYKNLKEIELPQKASKDTFFALKLKSNAPKGEFPIMFVEEFNDGIWMRLGGLPLDNMNFEGSRFFPLTEGSTKVRMIALGVESPFQVRFSSMGYGKTTGMYNEMSGTSMATPYVTGSYLALKSKFLDETVDKLKARLVGGVERIEGLNDTQGEGIVDLDKSMNNPNPVILNVVVTNKELILKGYFFGNNQGQIWVKGKNEKSDEWKSLTIKKWSDCQIKLKRPQVPAGYVDFIIGRNSEKMNLDFFNSHKIPDEFSRIRLVVYNRDRAWKKVNDLPIAIKDAVAQAVGNNIYVIGGSRFKEIDNRVIYKYNVKSHEWSKDFVIPKPNKQRAYNGITATRYDDKIYVATYDNLAEKNYFFVYDTVKKIWKEFKIKSYNKRLKKYIVKTPGSKIRGSLVRLGKNLYLVGGIYRGKYMNKRSDIWSINPVNGHTKIVARLPREKYDALVGNYKKSILIVGGIEGEMNYSNIAYIFDGNNLKRIKEPILKGMDNKRAVMKSFNKDRNIVIVNDGNSFEYSGLKYRDNTWKKWDYRVGQGVLKGFMGAIVDRYLFIIGGERDGRLTKDVYKIAI